MTQIYLKNKTLLAELHSTKKTYCYFVDPVFSDYHAIVGYDAPFDACIANKLIEATIVEHAGRKVPVILEPEAVVIRRMEDDHIPDDPDRVIRARKGRKGRAKTPFPPFKHWIVKDGELVEVGRSHWRGDLETGVFDPMVGQVNDNLIRAYMLLAKRIAMRPNFSGYSFKEDMQAQAVMALLENGLMFDESKSDNPFAYFTTSAINVFRRAITIEGRQSSIRDELLVSSGHRPSIGAQVKTELRSHFD